MAFYKRPEQDVLGELPGYSFAGNGVRTATGNFVWHERDIPMSDHSLSWSRIYNSRKTAPSALGPGWTHALNASVSPGSDNRYHFNDSNGRVLTFVRREDGSFARPQDIDADLLPAENGALELRFFDGDVWIFDGSGKLRSKHVGCCTATLVYEDHLLVRVDNSTGQWLALEYDGHGLLTQAKSNDGRTVFYNYDGGVLRQATVPGGASTTYGYDSEARIIRIVDADGVIAVANGYDEHGRVARQALPGSGALQFSYSIDEGITTATHEPSDAANAYRHNADYRTVWMRDAMGNETIVEYGPDGRLTKAELAGQWSLENTYADGSLVSSAFGGATTMYEYDRHRRLVKLHEPANGVTTFAYDGNNRLPSAVTNPGGSVTRFDINDGLITSHTGPDGNTVRYGYNGRRNLTERIDANGQRITYEYDAAGRRTETKAPTGDVMAITYDDAGRPVSVTDPGGSTVTNEYSATGRLISHTDAEGAVTHFEYDSSGRLVGRTDREGLVTKFDYDESGNLSTVVRPDGVKSIAQFDAIGRISQIEEQGSGVTKFEYDAAGNRTALHGPSGTTTMEFDARGNQTSITTPDGATTTFQYDAADRLIKHIDPDGAHWGVTFDSATGTTTYTNPDGSTGKEVEDPSGRVTASIDALGRRTTYHYDKAGNLETIVDPEGGRTRFVHDGRGRVIAQTTPAGLTTRYRYEKGRLVAVVDPRGWVTRFAYDRNGRRTQLTTPSGATTLYKYNKRGALVEVTDPRGGVTAYTYDQNGNLSKVVDSKGAASVYEHDEAGRRIATTDPLGRTTRRNFNEDGRLASIHNPAGDVIEFAYDKAGRLIRRWTNKGEEVSYAYDEAGQRISMTDADGTTRYTYDAAGRLTSATWPTGDKYMWEYDAAGQLRRLTYPGGTSAEYQYNLKGQMIQMVDSQAGEAVYVVDLDGRLITEQLPGGWARRYGYDGGLLETFKELRSGVIASHVTLTRDSEGRITRLEDGNSTHLFTYDKAGQLVETRWSGPEGRKTETDFGYDAAGNRTMSVTDGAATSYLYDVADQLSAIESRGRRIVYTYDGAGRLIRADDGDIKHDIAYDGFSQPTSTATSRGSEIERVETHYNGDGYMVHWRGQTGDESSPGIDMRYQWTVGDGLPQILRQQVNGANQSPNLADARFTYAYGRTFVNAEYDSMNFSRDAHGSAAATPSTMPWVIDHAYDSFGVPLSSSNPHDPLPGPHRTVQIPRFGYRGELTLGTGPTTLNLRARHYAPALGRFTTRDPVSQLGQGTLHNHPYAYAHNDPLNRVDPAGTSPILAQPALTSLLLHATTTSLACTGRCLHPPNTIRSHLKCFQDTACLKTRGYFSKRALDADRDALASLWHRRRRERVGHALTLYELNGRRQSVLRGIGEGFWMGRAVDENVDWEVGTRGRMLDPLFRIDALTDERDMLEVKLWSGGAYWEVEQQLDRYLRVGSMLGLQLIKSKELEDWADSVDVNTGILRWPWSGEIVYVWGMGNSEGHIYVASDEDDRLSDDMKALGDQARGERELNKQMRDTTFSLLPFRVPVGRLLPLIGVGA
ncbi:hypothetical protein MFIFM68171_04692 [Madurella fahalii]|uniref:Uncharacterized protein n=1 Tax=Madurella fahalii TaxID=1157608 RepID=A0ABQ0G9P3_9PEZI